MSTPPVVSGFLLNGFKYFNNLQQSAKVKATARMSLSTRSAFRSHTDRL